MPPCVEDEDKHSLIYTVCTTSQIQCGPQKYTRTAASSNAAKMRAFDATQKESSKAQEFAMQNHIGAKVGGGWWSGDASHDHQYSNSSSSSKASQSEKEMTLKTMQADSSENVVQLEKGEVFIEYMEVRLSAFTAKGKEKETHYLHKPLGKTVVRAMSKTGLRDLADMTFMEKDSWRLIFQGLTMKKEVRELHSLRALEKMLVPEVLTPTTPPPKKKSTMDEGGVFNIRNLYGGKSYWSYETLLSFEGTKLKLSPAKSTDKVPWRLEPKAGEKDVFYIRNLYRGKKYWSYEMLLSSTGKELKQSPRNSTDNVPWRLEPTGEKDVFYVRTLYGGKSYWSYEMLLSFEKYKLKLSPRNSTDKVAWRFERVPGLK